MYEMIYPETNTQQKSFSIFIATQTRQWLWCVFMLALCLLAIPLTSEYFMSLYQVSSSIRASMPSLALFEISNVVFWLTVFLATVS